MPGRRAGEHGLPHPEAGAGFPEGESWTPAGEWPNGKTLAHLIGCRDCKDGFERETARVRSEN